jgi:hypothetical protein
MRVVAFIFLVLFAGLKQAEAQSANPSPSGLFSGGMRGVRTYAGLGFANFNVTTPGLKLNDGIFVYLGGERGVNDHGLSVTITLNYMSTDGTAMYDYTTAGTHYTGNDIKFDSTNYQLSLGLRQRIFPTSWFRPYMEGGGLFGYHQIKYNGNLSSISATGGSGGPNGYKTKDSITGLGYYGEAGAEVDFSENYGTRVGVRYQSTKTRALETLGNQSLEYNNLLFIFSLLLKF